MSLSQLVRKLAGRDSPRPGQTLSGLSTGAVDPEGTMLGCDPFQSSIMAEGVPMTDGRRSNGGSTSSQGALANSSRASHESATSSSFLAGSLHSPLSADTTRRAASRAFRSQGKALLRSSTQEADKQLPSFTGLYELDAEEQPAGKPMDQLCIGSSNSSSSSLEAQLSEMSMSPSSSYQRSATAPLPSWTSPLALSTSAFDPDKAMAAPAVAAPAALLSNRITAGMDGAAAAQGMNNPLIFLGSAAADDALWCEEGELHCEWEDGIVASWLTDMDHPELLEMLHHEEELEAAAALQPALTTPNVHAVYSSSLFA